MTDPVVSLLAQRPIMIESLSFATSSLESLSKGDTLNKRRGKGWIPKWEAKVVTATVTKTPFEGTLHEDLKGTSPSEGFKGTSPSEGKASRGLEGGLQRGFKGA